jgi:drug/metabolite transporter (DMT)-like permease
MNTVAQLLLKKGIGFVDFNWPLFKLVSSLAFNIYVVCGVSIFIFSLFLWLYLLSQFDLSFLYPFGSLSYVLAAIGGWFFFSEAITLYRTSGIFLILVGVTLIAKNR